MMMSFYGWREATQRQRVSVVCEVQVQAQAIARFLETYTGVPKCKWGLASSSFAADLKTFNTILDKPASGRL